MPRGISYPPIFDLVLKIAVGVVTAIIALGLYINQPRQTADLLDKHITDSCIRITKVEDRLTETEKINVQLITELKNVNQNIAEMNGNMKAMNENILLLMKQKM